jgi:hypothetical protein
MPTERPLYRTPSALLLALGAVASGLFRVIDPDVWWRVRVGELVFRTRSLPRVDPFSYAAEGPWNNVEPLANLLLFGLHQAGEALLGDGPLGLELGAALLLAPLSLLLLSVAEAASPPTAGAERRGPRGLSLLLVGVGLSLAHFRFGPKPDLLSLLALTVLLGALLRLEQLPISDLRAKLRWASGVVLLALGWMLLHRAATLGLIALGLTGLHYATLGRRRDLAALALLSLSASAAAQSLAPGGLATLESAVRVLDTSAYAASLPEWRPPSATLLVREFPLLLVLLAAWSVLLVTQRDARVTTWLVAALAVLALRHVRFLPFLCVALVPELSFRLGRVRWPERAAARPALTRALGAALGLTALAVVYLTLPPGVAGLGSYERTLPRGAADFVQREPPPGRMYHGFNLGSFLLYALAPGTKQVFIDGRNDLLYPPTLYAESALAPVDAGVLERHLARLDAGFAVLDYGSLSAPRYRALLERRDWQLVYLDDLTAVVVRLTPASGAYLVEHGSSELRVPSALARAAGLGRGLADDAFAEDVLRLRRRAPRALVTNLLEALVHRARGSEAAYAVARRRTLALARERGAQLNLPADIGAPLPSPSGRGSRATLAP